MQLFYLGAVLTRPRSADAKMQPLHDSVINDSGRALAVPTPPFELEPAPPLQGGTGAGSPGACRGPRGPLAFGSWSLGQHWDPKENKSFPLLLKVVEPRGETVDWRSQ